MIGRKIRVIMSGEIGVVEAWDPLTSGMCDVTLRLPEGRTLAVASSSCRPVDGLGELPSRATARKAAAAVQLGQLKAIRDQLIADWHRPWPGCEHGKAIIGRAITGAIDEIEKDDPKAT